MPNALRKTLMGAAVGVLVAGTIAVPRLAGVFDRDANAAAGSTASLRKDLDAILNEPGSRNALASVMVRDAATGDVLYDHDGAERLLPASNTKLFTEVAAMEILGPKHTFGTDVLATGREGARADGLYLRGGGDPTMLAKDYDALAEKVADAGVKTVSGDLVADDTRYDDVRLGNGWSWDDEDAYYQAGISALNLAPDEDYDPGTVRIDVEPGAEAGEPAQVTTVPEGAAVEVDNRATTGGENSTISTDRAHGASGITVTGEIPVGADTDYEYVAVADPTTYAAAAFGDALEEHGVNVTGEVSTGATPKDAEKVAGRESMPLSELSVPFLKLSNNMHAEILTKEMGVEASGEGTWEAGIEARDQALDKLGVDTSTYNLDDGSGLTRRDFAPPEQITELLLAARERPWFEAMSEALPVAGDPDRMVGGTLTGRMRDTPAEGNVRAKTGSLTGVSGLSGYVTDADDRQLVFSILHNNQLDLDVKAVEDRIAVRLAGFSRDDTSARSAGVPKLPKPYTGPTDIECSWAKAC